MRIHAIVDQNALPFLPLRDALASKAVITPDVGPAIENLVDGGKETRIGLVVFLPYEKVGTLTASVRRWKKQGLHIKFIVLTAEKNDPGDLPAGWREMTELHAGSLSPWVYRFIIEKERARLKNEVKTKTREETDVLALRDAYRDQEDLIAIGRALSIEKNTDTLFRKILGLSRKITCADAGTIYIIEEDKQGGKQIRVKYADTYSKKISFEESVLPYNTGSIAGYAAITGKVLNIPDVYALTPDDPVSVNPAFDYAHHYRTKSMLVVPMRNHFDEIIGVIQLINSKEDFCGASAGRYDPFSVVLAAPEDFERLVVPFSPRYNRLLEAVAGQAAVAIENARMINQIKFQFEEFVKASVFAIESRDEATSGHSFRVAAMCLKLADAVTAETSGPFADLRFSEIERKEIEYAALLHDYGKVYVDKRVFQKAKKLYPEDLAMLLQKLEIAYLQAELRFVLNRTRPSETRTGRAETGAETGYPFLEKIQLVRRKITALNEPSVSSEEPEKTLADIAALLESFDCRDLDGNPITLLNDHERSSLAVPRGSLNNNERKEIERHVDHTYNFVSKIPWPKELERIPEIARGHHELLDGSGYPRGIKGKGNLPIESRMMVIADIYDALTAHDRPYKKALPVEKALVILEQEVNAGKLDPDLFALFRKHRVWEEQHDVSSPQA